mmetsp:Transcript_52560/g.125538  ORF Transcript_52560/g.125538 Transcript_52560/m.125538 type:complete len:316 (-) Transcript_52560:47-994(-)
MAAAAAEEPAGIERRLEESVLWKEGVLNGDHTSVWGSWYDATSKKWGYACCKELKKDSACPHAAAVQQQRKEQKMEERQARPQGQSSSDDAEDDYSATDSEREKDESKPWDWRNPPTELLPKEQVAGGKVSAYVQHFIMYILGSWRQALEKDKTLSSFTDIERAAFKDSLPETEKAVAPLLWRLKKGVSLNRGEGRYKTRCRETRTSMEGKYVKEKDVLSQLDRMVSAAASRDYVTAHETYVTMTFGNKMWNLTHVAHVAACTMKGAREYRRNRDSLNTYDMDPVSQKYMWAMKKIVHYAQVIHPNSDQSRNVVL